MNRIESSIGSYPSDWNIAVFETVAELKHGYQFRTHDFTKDGIKIFKITQIQGNGSINLTACDFIDSSRYDQFEKYKINEGDILMALSGATIGKIARYKSNETVLQNYRVGNFIPHDVDRLNKDYFYYFLCTEYIYQQVLANQTQSAQENVGKEDIHKMYLFLPPPEEQKAIAEVLCSIDDKIDLLQQQNEKLEELAEILYRQWFIVEADLEGEELFLSDVAEHHKKNIKPFENPFQEYFHYSIPAFDNRQHPQIEVGSTILSNKYQVITNSILISKLNPRFPRVWQISKSVDEEVSICSTEFQVVVPHEQRWFPFVYYFLKSRPVTDELIGAAGGTSGSHQRVSPDDIFNLSFIKPDDTKLSQFHQIVSPNLEKINNNREQILKLEKLRNTLLPKLMSGEVRVKMDDK